MTAITNKVKHSTKSIKDKCMDFIRDISMYQESQ